MKSHFFLLYVLAMLAFAMVNCGGSEIVGPPDNGGVEETLFNTEWKLVGVVDVESGGLDMLDPEKCRGGCYFDDAIDYITGELFSEAGCYTLKFGSEEDMIWAEEKHRIGSGIAVNVSFASYYTVDHTLSTINFLGFNHVAIDSLCDWEYMEPLYMAQTFELKDTGLKIHYNDVSDNNKAKYLLFEKWGQ